MASDVLYIQFEPAAAICDADVNSWNDLQYRCYWTLIWTLYCNKGKLKFELEGLATICHKDCEKFASEVWPKISEKFYVIKGWVRHRRVDTELRNARKYVQQKRKAGLISAQKRQQKSNSVSTQVQQRFNTSPTKVRKGKVSKEYSNGDISITPTIQECIDVGITIGIPQSQSEEFYHHYNKKGWVDGSGVPLTDLHSAMVSWRNKNYQFEKKESLKEKLKRL